VPSKIKTPKQYKPIGFVDRDDRGSLRQHPDDEVVDYDDGFKAGFKGRPNDDTKSGARQRGWAGAQE
jgi:hypothetical protein